MNESQSHITKAMVFAYFAHQATPLEKQYIEAWLKTEEGMSAYFTYLDDWERQFPQFQANEEVARERFNAFIREQVDPGSILNEDELYADHVDAETGPGWLKRNYGWIAAASVIFLAGLWFLKPLWYYRTLTNGNSQILVIALEDGSEVGLGTNSSLKYPRFGFGSRTREVWLEGDAEFKVEHLPDERHFNVYTPDGMVIEVLGTEFLVNSGSKTTRVALKTGSIRLTHPIDGQPLLMEPGDLVTISSEHVIRKEKLEAEATGYGWHVQDFEFKDVPLREVADQLQAAYGVRVDFAQPDVSDRRISGTFLAETPEDLLEAIAEMMELVVEKTPKGYVVKNSPE